VLPWPPPRAPVAVELVAAAVGELEVSMTSAVAVLVVGAMEVCELLDGIELVEESEVMEVAEVARSALAVVVPEKTMLDDIVAIEDETGSELVDAAMVRAATAVVVGCSVDVVEGAAVVDVVGGAVDCGVELGVLEGATVVDAGAVEDAGGVLLGAWLVVLGEALLGGAADDKIGPAFGHIACGPPLLRNATSTLPSTAWVLLQALLTFAVMACSALTQATLHLLVVKSEA